MIISQSQHLRHGNPGHRAIVCKVLTRACTPVYVMLTQWLLDGALEDPHHEFFIASDPTVADDRLWHDKYSIRYASNIHTYLSGTFHCSTGSANSLPMLDIPHTYLPFSDSSSPI